MGSGADQMVEAVFDVRTGYHVVTKAAGHFDGHPAGEGDPGVFTIIRGPSSALARENFWRIGADGRWEPTVKLDIQEHLSARAGAPEVEDVRLPNIYHGLTLAVIPGSAEDWEAGSRRFDTGRNALLTVGTGKTYATISAAITAASSGDHIACYETASNTYSENVAYGAKQLTIVGTVASQGLKIAASSGDVVDMGTSDCSWIENFEIDGTGGAARCVDCSTAYNNGASRCVAHGGSTDGFYGRSNVLFINCLAYDCNKGFSLQTTTGCCIQCTAVDNTTGGLTGTGANYLKAILCLASDNGTDFVNASVEHCMLNCSADATAPGAGSSTSTFTNADYTNYAADDFTLGTTTTAAKFEGFPRSPLDGARDVRKSDGVNVYAGWDDPDPVVPATPEAPAITGVSVSGLTVTAAVDGDAGVTNFVQLRRASTGAVEDEESRNDDGDIALDAPQASTAYALVPYSELGGYKSKPGAPWPLYLSGGVSAGEIAAAIVSRLSAASGVTSRLASSDAIHRRRPPRAASYPCITYELGLTPEADAVELGKVSGELVLELWGFDRDVLDELLEAVDDALSGERISTDHWELKHLRRLGAEPAGSEFTLPATGTALERISTRWDLRAYRKED